MVPAAVSPEKRKVQRCAGPAIDAPRPFRAPRENLKEKSSRIYKRRREEEREEEANFNKGQSIIHKRDLKKRIKLKYMCSVPEKDHGYP